MKRYSRIIRALCMSGALGAGLVFGTVAQAEELLVSGAASLTNAFKEVGEAFEKKHTETKVLNSFAASDVLLQQIVNGAPADVFASADQKAMDKAAQADVILPDSRADFVRNEVVLIVPSDNPKNVQGLASLSQADITRVAFGNPETVPVGRYTKGALEKMGAWEAITERQVLGQNVRQVLDYVSRGEVDAGFVFATDAAIMKDNVKVIEVLETVTPVTYPIAVVKREGAHPQAQAYVDFVLSDEGQAILAKYGFSKP